MLRHVQLRKFFSIHEIQVHPRSVDSTRDNILIHKKARLEQIINELKLEERRSVLKSQVETNTGTRSELVEKLLEVVIRYPTANSKSSGAKPFRERATISSLIVRTELLAAEMLRTGTDCYMGQFNLGDQAVQRPESGVKDQYFGNTSSASVLPTLRYCWGEAHKAMIILGAHC